MNPKRKLILPAVSALAVGGVLWAAQGPLPLASKPHPAVKHLNAKLAGATSDMSIGNPTGGSGQGCNATGGNKGLLSKATPATDTYAPAASASYSIVFNDASGLSCWVWTKNGSVDSTGVSQPAQGVKTATLTGPTDALGSDTISVFVVDGENGGKWDQYTWGPGISGSTSNNAVIFSSTCKALNGAEALLFNPSAWGRQVSATYMDEWTPTCWVWLVNGQVDTAASGSGPNPPISGNTSQPFTFTLNPVQQRTATSITLEMVDGDHGGDWDTYTWIKPGCYTKEGSTLSGTVNNKGEVAGSLLVSGCPGGPGHVITEKLSNGGPTSNVKTDPNGNFKFGGHPSNQFPATISFAGDSTAPFPATIKCDGYNTTCHT